MCNNEIALAISALVVFYTLQLLADFISCFCESHKKIIAIPIALAFITILLADVLYILFFVAKSIYIFVFMGRLKACGIMKNLRTA